MSEHPYDALDSSGSAIRYDNYEQSDTNRYFEIS